MAKVLVIEDDPVLLENTLELLQLEGFNAIGAENGCKGIEEALAQIPDLILCDVLMPRLDGYGVLEALRADPTTNRIPLVFVSANPRDDVVAGSHKLDVSDYLVKPVRAADLIGVVNRVLSS